MPGRVWRSDSETREGYTGHELDPETGLNYAGARYYDSALGRWHVIDPLWAQYPSYSPYNYAMNDPLGNYDPDGRSVWTKIAKVGYKVAKNGFNKASVAEAFAGNVQDAATLVSPTSTGLQRLGAGISLLSELAPVSVRDVTDVAGVAKNVVKGADAASDTRRSVDTAVNGVVGAAGGPRAGKNFTQAGKRTVRDRNASANGGDMLCENCGTETVLPQQSRRGVTPPGNEAHVDHILPKSRGGDGAPSNGQVLCRDCNLDKSNKDPRDGGN